MAVKRGSLGKGLSALMDEMEAAAPQAEAVQRGPQLLPVAAIVPNPNQPRRSFDEVALNELADSIRIKGLLQPILVRPAGDGRWEIVAGERRWRACQIAGLHEMPVVVRDFSDIDGFEAAIIENVQRADLNILEEAQGYQKLIRDYGHTQEMVSAVTGKSRSHVGNLIRLLDLPDDVQSLVRMGVLTLGHAKVLLQAKDPVALARRIAADGMNVRQAEEAARRSLVEARGGKPPISQAKRDHELEVLEATLSDHLGLKVAIEARGRRGAVTVKFSDLDQLDLIVAKLQA